MGIGIEEQETVIGFMRDEKFCTVYTSDSTVMTKLDKRVEKSKDWELIKVDKLRDGSVVSKTYKAPKRLISFRGEVGKGRRMSEEDRQKAAERLRIAREKKKIEKENKNE